MNVDARERRTKYDSQRRRISSIMANADSDAQDTVADEQGKDVGYFPVDVSDLDVQRLLKEAAQVQWMLDRGALGRPNEDARLTLHHREVVKANVKCLRAPCRHSTVGPA